MNPDWRKLLSGAGIRGSESDLTDEFAARFGFACAQWLAEKLETTPDKLTFSVGRDNRPTLKRLSAAVIRGLTAADCDILDCGMCAAPALFNTLSWEGRRANGAMMIVGSHAGAGVGEIRLSSSLGLPSAEDLSEILAAAQGLHLPQRLVTPVDPMRAYTEGLSRMAHEKLEDDALRPLLGLHVIVDASGGAGGFYTGFLEELGAETWGSYGFHGGQAPEKQPGETPLALLTRRVQEEEADLGVLLDTDCDRATLVDHAGKVLSGNRLIALIAAILLDEDPGATIVTDSVTSSGLSRFISEWGGVHYRFRRGSRNVIEEAKRLNDEGIDCPLAIETSGHTAFRDNKFLDDGLYMATWLICEAYDLKRCGKTLSGLIDDLAEPVESTEIRLRIQDEEPLPVARSVIETVLSHTLDNPAWRLATDSREGVRILFNLEDGVENAFFQLRMSVHEKATMVLNAESDVSGGVQKILSELYALLSDAPKIDLAPLKKVIDCA